MSMNLRYPNITGSTDKEQLVQIRSFLHQLVEQLNYALPNLGSGGAIAQSAAPSTIEVQGGEMSYYELRSLIINDLQKLDKQFETLSRKVYEDVDLAVTTSLKAAKDSGEFKGDPGYSPVKGKDYFTEDEINSVAKQSAEKITFTMDENGNLYYEVEE